MQNRIYRAAAGDRTGTYQRVVESITDAIVHFDAGWRLDFVNEAAEWLLQRRAEEICGRHLLDAIPEFAHDGLFEKFQAACRSGASSRVEYFVPTSRRLYECSCYPSGQGLTVVFRESIERHGSFELMRQQSDLLQLSHDAIVVWDTKRGITYWNRGAELLYDFSAAEALGQHPDELLVTRGNESNAEIFQVLRRHGHWSGTLRQCSRDGRPLTVTSRRQLIRRGEDGREVVFEINRDLTEQRRLTDRVQQLAAIADSTSDLVGTCDAQGKIVFVNLAGREMLGCDTLHELLGTQLADIHSPWAKEEFLREAMPVAALGEVWSGELEIQYGNGPAVPVSQVVFGHFDSKHVLTHYSTIARDISDQKSHEAELERMTELAQQASRAKSIFLARMSHEIRTPMTAILGLAEQLHQSAHDEDQQELTRLLCSQGRALLAILNDVLDLSRVEADEDPIATVECSITDLLKDLHRLMVPHADSLGLEMNLVLPPIMPKHIQTDPVRLRQILLNLLNNAFKFTHQGAVTIAVSVFGDSPANLQIQIIDTGEGIHESERSRIFDAFSRGDRDHSDDEEGTGLGLAIVRRFAKLLGASVDVESEVGEGSTFTVRLPVGDRDSLQWMATDDPSHVSVSASFTAGETDDNGRFPLRVLVAEDTAPIRLLLDRMLRSLVDELVFVNNGQDAVDAVVSARTNHRPFDVILMDMQMPVMNGVEATRTLRRFGDEIPVVALTAGAMDADRDQCLRAGCDHFLTKPIDREELFQTLDRYVPR